MAKAGVYIAEAGAPGDTFEFPFHEDSVTFGIFFASKFSKAAAQDEKEAQAAELTCHENWRVLPKFSHLWDCVCSLPLPFSVASVSFCSSQAVNSHFLIWQAAPPTPTLTLLFLG